MSNAEYINRLEPVIRAARPERLQKVLFNYFPKDAIAYLVDPAADIACANSLYQSDPTEIITGVNLFAAWLEHTVNYPLPRIKAILETIGIFNECAKDLHDIIRCIWVSPQGDKAALHAKVQKQLGLLLSPMSGNEIAKDGLPFIRDSNLSA